MNPEGDGGGGALQREGRRTVLQWRSPSVDGPLSG